jgi:oligosaccharide repeat unit polymerase
MNKKSYIHYSFASLAALVVFSVFILSVMSSDMDPYVSSSFIPVAMILIVAIFVEASNRAYSLHLMHILLLFVLMVLAPFYQYLSGSFPWDDAGTFFENNDVIFANGLVMLWVIVYLFGYWLGRVCFRDRHRGLTSSFFMRELTHDKLKILFFLSICVIFYMAAMGYSGVYTRLEYESITYKGGQIYYLILSYFVRVIPYVFLVVLILLKDGKNKPFNGILLVSAIVIFYINNPLAAARFWLIVIVLAVICALYLRKLKTAYPLLIMGLFGVVFLPTLNAGRYYTDLNASYLFGLISRNLDNFKGYLANSGDFDAYSNLMRSVIFVDENGITWGHQLLGSLFFWIPRQFWEGKPTGSGHMVANFLDLKHANISFPMAAEGYINFGLIGIIIFAMSFGVLLNYIDSKYYLSKRHGSAAVRLIDVLYLFLLGMIIFITRGDMMSSFSYTVALSLAVIVSTVSFTRKKLGRSSR